MKTNLTRPPAFIHNPIRNSLLVLLSSITFAGATVIDFDLSPTGTNTSTGLSPANEVPAATNSTGSGNVISGGIFFDTVTSTLSFAVGYGSAAGFTDLTGPATGAHIHGPAGVGVNAGVLFDLAPGHFPALSPAMGGLIYGSVVYTPDQAADLLAGRNYVNIHTSTYPGGEIRGQLIRANAAPDVTCQPEVTVNCGVPFTYTASVSDIDGDAVQATWTLNGVPVETDNIAAGEPPSTAEVSYTGTLPLGVNTLAVIATDSYGNVTTCMSTITVADTVAPVIVSAGANPRILWPPNNKMVPVRVRAKVTDDCGPTTWKIVSVKSNQPAGDKGKGKNSTHWTIIDDHTVLLRAERSGKRASGRVYVITIRATDAAGNQSDYSTVRVVVPHDRRKGDR